RTTTRWVRQGDCCVCVTTAKCTSQKMWSTSTFRIDATKRRPRTRRDSTDQFRTERGAACERFGACLAGKNVRDLRRHDRRRSAALDERTGGDRRLAYCGIFDAALLDTAAQTS